MAGCFSVTSSYSRDLSPEDEAVGMAIPDGFRLQSRGQLAALDGSLVIRGVLVRLGMGWFGVLITRKSQAGANQIKICTTIVCTLKRTKACVASSLR